MRELTTIRVAIEMLPREFVPRPKILKYYRSFSSRSNEPFHISDRKPPKMTAEEAVKMIKSNDIVYVQGAAATPYHLLENLANYAKKSLKNITLCHIHTEGPAVYNQPEFEGIIRTNSFFLGKNCRKVTNEGRGDFIPIFLSEIGLLFKREIINLDASLVQVTPPDTHGFCSLGTSVDCTREALMNSKIIIAQVNPQLPRTFGDGLIHESHFDAIVDVNQPIFQHPPAQINETENRIGKIIADNLVTNKATLQMGIGNIPDAVLSFLHDHKDLGVHSEMFSDGIVDLLKKGCINNHYKQIQPGHVVGSFCIGTDNLYKFMDNNPLFSMLRASYVNNPSVIAQNPLVTAINSCIEIDLTGQICSDSIGTKMYSGVGGQVDFLRGAAAGLDGKGKPIIAIPSVTKHKESKIVPYLKAGAGVVTTRAHVHYVVTEYGIAYLFGRNLRQRAHALIEIAHPDHREKLEQEAFKRLKCMPSPW